MAVGNRLVGAVENKVKDAAAHVMDKTFENPGDACPSREPDDTTPITLQYGEKLNEKTMSCKIQQLREILENPNIQMDPEALRKNVEFILVPLVQNLQGPESENLLQELQDLYSQHYDPSKKQGDQPEEPCNPIQKYREGFRDLAGMQNEKAELVANFIRPITFSHLFYGSKSKYRPERLLLYGPPGTGKTLITRALVRELNEYIQRHESQQSDDTQDLNLSSNQTWNTTGECAERKAAVLKVNEAQQRDLVFMFNVGGAELKGMYSGQTEQRIQRAFQCANSLAECRHPKNAISIIFIDEIESIGGKRTGDPVQGGAVTALLTQMEGATEYKYVKMIAATNLPWQLDGAVLRRFDAKILVDLPQEEARQELIRMAYNGLSDRPKEPAKDETENTGFADLKDPKGEDEPADDNAADEEDPNPEWNKMTVAQLRQKLKDMGLDQKGLKAELVARLQNASSPAGDDYDDAQELEELWKLSPTYAALQRDGTDLEEASIVLLENKGEPHRPKQMYRLHHPNPENDREYHTVEASDTLYYSSAHLEQHLDACLQIVAHLTGMSPAFAKKLEAEGLEVHDRASPLAVSACGFSNSDLSKVFKRAFKYVLDRLGDPESPLDRKLDNISHIEKRDMCFSDILDALFRSPKQESTVIEKDYLDVVRYNQKQIIPDDDREQKGGAPAESDNTAS